jgi:hypothetical protein
MRQFRNAPGKMSYLLTALSGICGQLALGVYYSGVLVPQQPGMGNFTAQQLMEFIAHNRIGIFWDAYLQSIGTLLSVIFFIRLVFLSGSTRRFAGWMVIITSSVILAIALLDVTFTVAAANAALAGHSDTVRVAVDFITGSTEAFDYTFLFVPAPLLIISLAAVLLASNLFPRIFGYVAIVIGIAFVVLGVFSLFNTLVGIGGIAFEIVQLIQVIWVLASAVFILIYSQKKLKP